MGPPPEGASLNRMWESAWYSRPPPRSFQLASHFGEGKERREGKKTSQETTMVFPRFSCHQVSKLTIYSKDKSLQNKSLFSHLPTLSISFWKYLRHYSTCECHATIDSIAQTSRGHIVWFYRVSGCSNKWMVHSTQSNLFKGASSSTRGCVKLVVFIGFCLRVSSIYFTTATTHDMKM